MTRNTKPTDGENPIAVALYIAAIVVALVAFVRREFCAPPPAAVRELGETLDDIDRAERARRFVNEPIPVAPPPTRR